MLGSWSWQNTMLKSLRLRLLAGTLLWVVITVVVAGWGLNQLFQQHIQRQLVSELDLHLNQLTAALDANEAGKITLSAPLSDPRFQEPFSGLYWQIDQLADEGITAKTALLRSRSLWDFSLTLPLDGNQDNDASIDNVMGPDDSLLFIRARLVQPAEAAAAPLHLLVAANASLLTEPVGRFNRILVISLSLLATGLMLAAVVQVLIGLRPLGLLRRQLIAVREGHSPHVNGHFPSELQPLVDEFNSVLVSNAQVVARAQTQAGNLAHAVKTPLTILANAAQHERNEFSALVLEQVAMARRQVDHHLLRARAAASVGAAGLRTPVGPPLQALVRVMQRLHAESNLKIDLILESDNLVFRGEEHDLQEMLGNLLDNACKWAKHRILIKVSRVASAEQAKQHSLQFTIDDDGLGLAPEQREQVFKRGVRADEQVPGSGLGLAIVRDLAQLYGGEAQAYESPLGGLGVVLRLPAG